MPSLYLEYRNGYEAVGTLMLAEQGADGLGSSWLVDVEECQGLGVCRLASTQAGFNRGGLSCLVIGIENRKYPVLSLQKGQQPIPFVPQHHNHLGDSSLKQR